MKNQENISENIQAINDTDYSKQLTDLNIEKLKLNSVNVSLGIRAFKMAMKVNAAFNKRISIKFLFKHFLTEFDNSTCHYYYLVEQNPAYSFLIKSNVSNLKTKVRNLGYMISTDEAFNVNIEEEVKFGDSSIKVYQLPIDEFNDFIGIGNKDRDSNKVINQQIKTFESVLKAHITGLSKETLISSANAVKEFVSTLEDTLKAKVKAEQEKQEKQFDKLYKKWLKENEIEDCEDMKQAFKSALKKVA